MERRVVGRQRAPGGGRVRRLRVVDVADAADLGDELEPVLDARERAQRRRRSRRRRARPRGLPPSRRRRSRGCARPGSTARPAARRPAANSTRRAEPGTGPNPRGTTATSSPVWFSKIRSFAARYASKLPCRSRWSGSRLSSTAIRGRKRSTSSSWKLESSQTTHSSARHVADELAQRRADVAGGARAEHRAEQLGRRRLPVRAGDAEDRVRQQPRRQLDLAPDRDPPLARGRDERRLARHARALDEHLDAVEQGEILVVAERPVGGDDLRPTRLERGLRRPPRAREAEDERPLHKRNSR